MRPDRLIREAHRTAERLQIAAFAEAAGAGTSIAKWLADKDNIQLIVAALGAMLAVPVTLIIRKRQLRRAHWLETTADWGERLEEMPRMEPFPKVVDFFENRFLFRRRTRKATR